MEIKKYLSEKSFFRKGLYFLGFLNLGNFIFWIVHTLLFFIYEEKDFFGKGFHFRVEKVGEFVFYLLVVIGLLYILTLLI